MFFDTLLGGKDEKKDCCNYVLSVGMIEISGTQEGRSTTMLKLTQKRHERIFKKYFLQKPYRIILGPPKHVLHLVWSVLGISTAIKQL